MQRPINPDSPSSSNIANAKIQGMDKDLHLHGNQYNMAVMVFTVAYVIFGVPANLVFKKFGPKTLSIMMLFWGKSIQAFANPTG